MKLRGYDWGNVFNASGARGFFGEGYWFHKAMWPFGLSYKGSTLVTKTTTLEARAGNMPLDDEHQPIEGVPSCIIVKPLKGVVLNSVGLSGPGAAKLIERWGTRGGTEVRFVVSFMSVAEKGEDRIREAGLFTKLMAELVPFKGTLNMAVQINFSCPNTGVDVTEYKRVGEEMRHTLNLFETLGIPLMVKVNALFPIPILHEVAEQHAACDAIVCSNTIPWGKLPAKIDWEGLFGKENPIEKRGFKGGGLSGKPLLPIVQDWITRARYYGITKPIIGGGGILSSKDADVLIDAGANAIELGSVSILRPWRVRSIIKHVNKRLGEAN
jgi:dihydroorotate dehydrogenase (NAD+) catalytic subunit